MPLFVYGIITEMTFLLYLGQQLAEWLVNGYPSLDVFGYDINRFNPTMTDNDKWINEDHMNHMLQIIQLYFLWMNL